MAQEPTFALITGCSSGIGKALAIAFAAKGVTVLATARRTESLSDLTSQYDNIEALSLELGKPGSIEKLRDAVLERTGGHLDFLVNNAGTHYASTAVDLEIDEVAKLFEVNVFAVMRLCQIFVPLLRRAYRARIVQIGSVTRNVPAVWQAPYNASKAALSQYSKTLRLELQPLGIEVIEIVTGFVQSNILHHGLHAPDDSLYLPIKSTVEDIKYRGNKNGILASYFDNLQDANPIFSKEGFFNRYQNSLCAEDLISTIVIITAKLTGFTANGDDLQTLNAELDLLSSSSLLEDDLIGATPSIGHFRKAYRLAFYEFHQFPGHHAWLRVGRITHMAYRIGLDRLDHVRALYSDWGVVSSEDMQEWRWIWWCIYRLDCYTNLSSGMPYLIDDACISTSLIESNTLPVSDMVENIPQSYFLPLSPENITKILLFVPSHPDTLLRNVHTITTATLQQVGKVVRMHLVRSPQATLAEAANVEKLLATIRTALPPGWLNTRRNAFANESHNDYHARMVTILHLRMAQLLLAIVDCGQRCGADEWLAGWERIIEPCQDMASITEHWNSAFCLAVDPAVSFTLFTAPIFLKLHKKTMTTGATSATTNEPSSSIIDHHITILRLQLEHFAQVWTLPRILKLSFESFHQSVSGPLTHGHIALILSHFEAPLHPRWLQFLSTAHTVLAVS
ncbi:hypothetical protein BDV09DRAFT_202304 [Aspergillus tetrazonus]